MELIRLPISPSKIRKKKASSIVLSTGKLWKSFEREHFYKCLEQSQAGKRESLELLVKQQHEAFLLKGQQCIPFILTLECSPCLCSQLGWEDYNKTGIFLG
ncbi:hypothetical protein TNCT_313731 [Trichonephila clavata]|uniref:Uncharacterized protein n=1 Tax=Trichonephila clavata TaxID=2740835 RepID=A0A8X6K7F4_TRICU|nr:hypothetical protein TNCT_313731 [Trichonephila clavata]